MTQGSLLLAVLATAWTAAATATPASAAPRPFQNPDPGPDSVELRRGAERAQERFERLRRREAEPTPGGYRGPCDLTVGRMCLRFGPGDDWWPGPDPPRVVEARDSLLVRLARTAAGIPGDGWVTGQRVAYLAEARRLRAALEVAEACVSPEPGWCHGLRGLVLHRQGRYPDAEKAFHLMVAAMDPVRAREWSDPALLLDPTGRSALESVGEPARGSLVTATWRWADPLFLVPGNDRWTEHLARHVMNRIRSDAENPYALRWGEDLAEMLLRYGWEEGWERVDPSPAMMTTATTVLGQEHPQARSFMPPGGVLEEREVGQATTADEWSPSARPEPRTGYAPAYAPVFLPAEGLLFRFPRGDSLVLVAWLALPPDTSVHAGHDHPPLRESLRWQGLPPAVGLFAEPTGPDRDPPLAHQATTRTGSVQTALALTLAPGRHLVSGEVWAPDSARAGRIRREVVWTALPPDRPTLSDLVLVSLPDEDPQPATLEDALPRIREVPPAPGDSVGVAWELSGLPPGREGHAVTLRYRMTLRRDPGGFLRRLAGALGLVGNGAAVELSWSEDAPRGPGPGLRTTRLLLPGEMEPGRYRLDLRVELPGREPLVASRELRVVDSSR